jgi:hypothetical protein
VNPFNAIAELILGKIKEGIYVTWAKVCFQLLITAWGSFFLTCGGVLSAYALAHFLTDAAFESGPVWGLAIGTGMTVMVLCVVYWIRTEPTKFFKGMRFVFPSEEAAKELATNFEVIQKLDIQKTDQEKK